MELVTRAGDTELGAPEGKAAAQGDTEAGRRNWLTESSQDKWKVLLWGRMRRRSPEQPGLSSELTLL